MASPSQHYRTRCWEPSRVWVRGVSEDTRGRCCKGGLRRGAGSTGLYVLIASRFAPLGVQDSMY